jgi:hypothetical protein
MDIINSYEYARVDAVFTRSLAAAQYKSGTASLRLDYRSRQLETLLINHNSFPLESLKVRPRNEDRLHQIMDGKRQGERDQNRLECRAIERHVSDRIGSSATSSPGDWLDTS